MVIKFVLLVIFVLDSKIGIKCNKTDEESVKLENTEIHFEDKNNTNLPLSTPSHNTSIALSSLDPSIHSSSSTMSTTALSSVPPTVVTASIATTSKLNITTLTSKVIPPVSKTTTSASEITPSVLKITTATSEMTPTIPSISTPVLSSTVFVTTSSRPITTTTSSTSMPVPTTITKTEVKESTNTYIIPRYGIILLATTIVLLFLIILILIAIVMKLKRRSLLPTSNRYNGEMSTTYIRQLSDETANITFTFHTRDSENVVCENSNRSLIDANAIEDETRTKRPSLSKVLKRTSLLKNREDQMRIVREAIKNYRLKKGTSVSDLDKIVYEKKKQSNEGKNESCSTSEVDNVYGVAYDNVPSPPKRISMVRLKNIIDQIYDTPRSPTKHK